MSDFYRQALLSIYILSKIKDSCKTAQWWYTVFQGISNFWFITRKFNIMIHFNSFCFSLSEILSKSSQLCTKYVTYHRVSRKQRENSLKKQWFDQHSKKRWLVKHCINQYALPYYFLLPEGTTELLKVKKKKNDKYLY